MKPTYILYRFLEHYEEQIPTMEKLYYRLHDKTESSLKLTPKIFMKIINQISLECGFTGPIGNASLI